MWDEITDTNPCLADKYVSTVSFDDQGRAWIGTKGDGLVILQGEDCDFYTTANSGLNNDFISRIEFDPQGRVWIGTAGGGVNLLVGEKWIEYTPFNTGLMDYSIRDIAFDTQNQVWIMHRHLGISIADLDQITSIPITPLNILLLTPSARWFLPMILIGLFLQLNLPVMIGRDIRSIHIRVNRWVFWFGWIFANTLGFGLGHIVSLKIIHEHPPLSIGDPHPISSVALPILLILFFQVVFMYSTTSKGKPWVIASGVSLVAGVLFVPVTRFIAMLLHPGCYMDFSFYGDLVCYPYGIAAVTAICIAFFGVILGIVQAILLSKRFLSIGTWILMSAVLWILIGVSWETSSVGNGFLIGALSGGLYGSISGTGLIWMMMAEKGDSQEK